MKKRNKHRKRKTFKKMYEEDVKMLARKPLCFEFALSVLCEMIVCALRMSSQIQESVCRTGVRSSMCYAIKNRYVACKRSAMS